MTLLLAQTIYSNQLSPNKPQAPVLQSKAEEDNLPSEGVDSNHFSGSNSSFLANEKLMSVDSMNSDLTGMTGSFHNLNLIHALY